MKVPLLNLKGQYSKIQSEVEASVLDVLRSGIYVLGPKVRTFEEEAAKFLGAKHAVGCANGSDALYLSLLALDVKAGDEVITTPFTYAATAEAIDQIGAKPVFADIELETYNIDPKEIEAKITAKTKAIIIVHLYGQCCDMDAIMAIAKKHNIKVVEDAAQAFGASCKFNGETKSASAIADIGTFSFYPTKNLSCAGDGGLLTTNCDELAQRLKRIRCHGSSKRYYHDELGVNSRLDEIQAAILLIKLKYIADWNQRRIEIAKIYNDAFSKLKGIHTPKVLESNKHIYHQYTLRIDEQTSGQNRDKLKENLLEQGVASEIYYPLALHMQKLYEYLNHKPEDFPNALKASKEVLCLPIYPEMSDEDAKTVASTILELSLQAA